MTTHTITTAHSSDATVSVNERGTGHPILMLHGGGGPATVNGFADLFAEQTHSRVLTPTHPGFGSTPRPDDLDSIPHLAQMYVGLLDDLDLTDVTVVGNSVGGWIAAEMALLHSRRISSIVLVDAVGIDVPGHPVADFFSLTFPELAALSYYSPDSFMIDPSTMSAEQQAVMAGNRSSLATYIGATAMADTHLRSRLGSITVPVLVVWGEADRIVDVEYGRAYAAAIPGAEFTVLPKTGHLPQIETPGALVQPILQFANANSVVHGGNV